MNRLVSIIKFKNIAIAFGIAIFFMADRALKTFALSLGQDTYYKIISDLFLFRFTPNRYISFSLPITGIILNIVITLIIACLSYYIFYLLLGRKNVHINKQEKKTLVILLIVILFGAISNLQDRLQYGYVIDYLELNHFTVFNLADVMISIGSIILIYLNLKKNK